MDDIHNVLFVEKYRPKTIDDCVLPRDIKKVLKSIAVEGRDNFPNMILSGGPGCGKTTAARAMCEELGLDYLFINGSDENGIDVLRTKIRGFASTLSLTGGLKVVILDEADHLNPTSTQPALRGFIEEFSSNCRFIMTCNYKNKIIPALHSRCPVIDFKIPKTERVGLAGEMFELCKSILKREGIQFDSNTLAQAVKTYFPDFRMILGKLQHHSKNGSLDNSIVSSSSNNEMSKLFEILRSKKFIALREWVADNSDGDVQRFYSDLYKYIWRMNDEGTPIIDSKSLAVAIGTIQEYSYQSAFTIDPEINMMACLTMLMVEVTLT